MKIAQYTLFSAEGTQIAESLDCNISKTLRSVRSPEITMCMNGGPNPAIRFGNIARIATMNLS